MADAPDTAAAAGGTDPTGGGAPPTKGGGIGAWFKRQNKTTIYTAGAGIVVAIALYVRSRQSSAANTAASTTTATPASTLDPTSTYTGGGGEGGGGDFGGDLTGLQTSITGLQTAIAGLPGAAVTPASPTAGYSPITNDVANTVQGDLSANAPVDYEESPGSPLLAVSQPTAGGSWYVGGAPIAGQGNPSGAPGAPSEFFTPNAAPLASSAAAPAPNVALS